jgi:DNA invertase Pin-like site-specific DNA recombinase
MNAIAELPTLHIYTRVSTAAQAEKNTSLASQLELGIRKARELGFPFNHWNEGGRSSHHEEIEGRPVLFRLYQAIKSGQVKHLWVYDQSRLSRNDQVASVFRYQCNKQGVRIYTKDGQFDLSSPQDKFLKQLLDATAEFDNALRAERTRIGKLARVKSGQWHGGPPPFGYYIHAKRLQENPREAYWVREIFSRILCGASVAQVKKHLEDNNVQTRRGNAYWSLGSIRAILGNTHYKGYYDFKDAATAETIRVECPPILDELLWNGVQYQDKESRRKQRIASLRRNPDPAPEDCGNPADAACAAAVRARFVSITCRSTASRRLLLPVPFPPPVTFVMGVLSAQISSY